MLALFDDIIIFSFSLLSSLVVSNSWRCDILDGRNGRGHKLVVIVVAVVVVVVVVVITFIPLTLLSHTL